MICHFQSDFFSFPTKYLCILVPDPFWHLICINIVQWCRIYIIWWHFGQICIEFSANLASKFKILIQKQHILMAIFTFWIWPKNFWFFMNTFENYISTLFLKEKVHCKSLWRVFNFMQNIFYNRSTNSAAFGPLQWMSLPPPLLFFATQIINPFLTSRIWDNHDKGLWF